MTLFLMLFCLSAQAAFNLQPNTHEEFINILKNLATDHASKQWCEKNCAQIQTVRLSGKIEDGKLALEITGEVIGKRNGVVPLFLATPPAEITTLKFNDTEVSLIFHNKTYYTVLPPGSFRLIGEVKIDRTSGTNFTLPGAVGQVLLDISDQESLLKAVPMGQTGGSFQVVPKMVATDPEKKATHKVSLRFEILKKFIISRDKSFLYSIHVIGAQPGQVIPIALEQKEKVLHTNPANSVISANKVEFTATSANDTFEITGEWQQEEIKLAANPGPVQETWELVCEGAYDCHFSGDAEKVVHTSVHQWVPSAGQSLVIDWQELNLLKGQSLVAQQAVLQTDSEGKGLKQSLTMLLTSSAMDHLYIQLPDKAIPLGMHYDQDESSPVLENEKGWLHLSIPQGQHTVTLNWEIGEHSGISIPLPKLSLPIGKWFYWLTPNDHEALILSGGLAGSPVVLFWLHLTFCLLLAASFLYVERKFFPRRQTSLPLFVLLCAGFALGTPISLLSFFAFLLGIRLLSRVQKQRSIFGWIFELSLLLMFTIAALSSYVILLDSAFFSNSPFAFENFCSSTSGLNVFQPANSFCWELTLPHLQSTLDAPHAVAIPIFLVRVIYFIWALITGYYLYTELLVLLQGLKKYVKLGTRPVVRSTAKSENKN